MNGKNGRDDKRKEVEKIGKNLSIVEPLERSRRWGGSTQVPGPREQPLFDFLHD